MNNEHHIKRLINIIDDVYHQHTYAKQYLKTRGKTLCQQPKEMVRSQLPVWMMTISVWLLFGDLNAPYQTILAFLASAWICWTLALEVLPIALYFYVWPIFLYLWHKPWKALASLPCPWSLPPNEVYVLERDGHMWRFDRLQQQFSFHSFLTNHQRLIAIEEFSPPRHRMLWMHGRRHWVR